MSPERREELDNLIDGLALMKRKITAVRFFDEKISCEIGQPSAEEHAKLLRMGWSFCIEMGQHMMEKGEWWGWSEEGSGPLLDRRGG